MIKMTVFRDKAEKTLKGFTVEGHSGYGTEGGDIICAAISATAYNALNGLEEISGLKGFYRIDEKGKIECMLPANAGTDHRTAATAETILRLTEIGFEQIAAEHGKYVSVEQKEI